MRRTAAALLLLLALPGVLPAETPVMLVGGGFEDDNSWSDGPFGWFVQAADSGVVVNLDTDEASPWYPGYFQRLGADSGSHALAIPGSAVDDETVLAQLEAADAIFLEGGDQWDYVSTWAGTPVEAALQAHIDRGEPIGGTSAGLAVLGDVIFDARHGTVYPEEAAWNAWNYYLTLTDDFLEVLPGVLPDSHFQERGRLGRLVPMLARRIVEHGETGLLGVGVDAYSALTVDAQRRGRVWGESVTFLSATPASVVAAPAGAAPTFTHIRFDMVLHGGLYDLDARQLLETGEALSALDAEEAPSPAGADTLLEGSSEAVRTAGAVQVGGLTGDPDNWWHGDLTISPGDSTLPAAVVVPNVWADSDYYANRVVGAQFALAQHPSLAAVWLDDASRLQVTGGTELAAQGYALVLNGWGATHAGLGSYNQPGLVGATLHALGEGDAVNLAEVYAGVERERRTPAPPPGPAITGVWPNPANAAVSIGLELPTAGPARLRVLDLLGREVGVVPVPPAAAGGSRVQWQAGRLPSGRYLLLLEAEGTRAVRSVTIVK